jgi:hypothetical protein
MVAIITEEQAKNLKGKLYTDGSYFNPVQDADENWVISIEEIEQCDLQWLKDLPLIGFNPIAFLGLPEQIEIKEDNPSNP